MNLWNGSVKFTKLDERQEKVMAASKVVAKFALEYEITV